MVTQKTNQPVTPNNPVLGEAGPTSKQTEAVGKVQTWQELKGRITALRRGLHATPVDLIGDSCWAERVRELEECQKRLELLRPPPSLRPLK
jgi:hypothetical protein